MINLVATASQANPLAAKIPWSSSASSVTKWPLRTLSKHYVSRELFHTRVYLTAMLQPAQDGVHRAKDDEPMGSKDGLA